MGARWLWISLCLAQALRVCAGEGSADLRLRISHGETLRYVWEIKTENESQGRTMGKPFTVKRNATISMTQIVKGSVAKKDGGMPVSLRVLDYSMLDKRAINADSTTELQASKKHMKYTENGVVKVDSDNEIGIESLANWQKQITAMENSEVRVLLDAQGRQSEISGDPAMADNLKETAQTIFPVLPGKEAAVGESWTDTAKIQKLSEFKLARPAVENSKLTFARWETKNGRTLAVIELASAWEKQDLKGENAEGLLAEFSGLEYRRTGTCYFDPAIGQFVDGGWQVTVKYHVDGERDGQTVGVDVTEKHTFSFARKD